MADLNNPKVPLAVALGGTTARVVMTLIHTAKAQGKPYDAEVVFHAGFEIIPAMYLIGSANGVFKGMPPFKGFPDDGQYEFEDDEMKVIGEGQMQGTRALGNLMVKAGMITEDVAKANMALWKKRIEQEEAHGNISDEVMEKMAQGGVFDKIHDQLGTSGFAGHVGKAQPLSGADSFPADANPAAAAAPTGNPGQAGLIPDGGA